jgi:hypothetical protein
MKRITRTLAREIAEKLISKRETEIEMMELAIGKWLVEQMRRATPPEIISCADKHPSYFNIKRRNICVARCGFSYQNVPIPEGVSYPIRQSENTVYLDREKHPFVDDLRAQYKIVNDARNGLKKLEESIINTLIGLRTYARISEKFPEAIPYLPADENLLPCITDSVVLDVRNKLYQL